MRGLSRVLVVVRLFDRPGFRRLAALFAEKLASSSWAHDRRRGLPPFTAAVGGEPQDIYFSLVEKRASPQIDGQARRQAEQLEKSSTRGSATNGIVAAKMTAQKTVTKRPKTVTNRGQNCHKTGEKLSLCGLKLSQSVLNTGI